ncbi:MULTISPECIES: cation:proton antiporter [unclassified Rhizobium]|nr:MULTISPECIES: cation:proton antiporter [unclassified Rhizobium]KQS83774.1 cation transporter [Rhizobium sp. Leaf386]KQT04911.1 cation transporter [Rhizobium sp. Leaf391]KQU08714.1 cation transporter [Rhizobium sp. Leaf453]
MHQDMALVTTVAVSFVLAAAFGYCADRLRLPPLVGYLVAGIMIGPFTPGIAADSAMAAQLAEIGVILLMFGVGLHFSASDLIAVRGVAIPGAIGQIVLATLLGMGLTTLWGWSLGAGLVFGLSISVASTVVLLKALEERNLVNSPNGRVAIGWLIVEDLAMVLALVLLPILAQVLGDGEAVVSHAANSHATPASGGMDVMLTIAMTVVKLAAFAALAIILGPRIVPWILTLVARTGSRELFTLTVLATAVGLAFGSAAIFGVSFALGAFFAGVIMSESHLSHRAAADSLPLQNAFSVLFFVSVGMLFNPHILIQQPLNVLAIVALITLGKSIIAIGVVLALRYPMSMALTVGASLGQIGEFSFIVAGLGISLGLLSQEGHDLILAGAILSITLNPLLFWAAGKLKAMLGKTAPTFVATHGASKLAALSRELEIVKARVEEKESQQQLKKQQLVSMFPLFSQVDEHALEELLLLFRPDSAEPGDKVIRVGERGDAMYFISAGTVEVRLEAGSVPLEAGAFFGEMALLSGGLRTADVIAVDFCQFLKLDRRDFNMFMARHPRLRTVVSDMARERKQMNVVRETNGGASE